MIEIDPSIQELKTNLNRTVTKDSGHFIFHLNLDIEVDTKIFKCPYELVDEIEAGLLGYLDKKVKQLTNEKEEKI